jgi:hypothetical protein
LAKIPTVPKVPTYQAPTYQAPTAFKPFTAPKYNNLTQTGANQQASTRLKPQYAQTLKGAIDNVRNQTMSNGFYGQSAHAQYEADTSAQINTQKQTDIAILSQQLMNDDKTERDRQLQQALGTWTANRGAYDSDRSFGYNKFNDNRSFGYGQYQQAVETLFQQYGIDYNKYRDTTADSQWLKQFNEGKRQFNKQY